MKKKIALLGIILMDKSVLILDEPFNGMDFEGVELLYEILSDLKNRNKTIIITSHIIETLFNTCDKIALLENKKISTLTNKENFSLLQHGFHF